MAAVAFVLPEQVQAEGWNSFDHILLELSLGEAVEIQALREVESLWQCWQEPLVGQEGERTQGQVQGLALVRGQGEPPWWGLQQV